MYAAENKHLKIVKLLIGKGADSNEKDNDGKMAIDLARERGVSNKELDGLLNVCKS